jgi:biotin synthase-like enzyme
MSAKNYKLSLPASTENISKARKAFKEMSKVQKIELMVSAGVMTREQAERAKQKAFETKNSSKPKVNK